MKAALYDFRPRQLRYHALVLSECNSPVYRQPSLSITVDRDGFDRIFTDVHRLAVTHRLNSWMPLTWNWRYWGSFLWQRSILN